MNNTWISIILSLVVFLLSIGIAQEFIFLGYGLIHLITRRKGRVIVSPPTCSDSFPSNQIINCELNANNKEMPAL